jgi:hypothetical protein
MATSTAEKAALKKIRDKQLINKHATPGSAAHQFVNRKPKKVGLMEGFKNRIGKKLIGKSKVTGKY